MIDINELTVGQLREIQKMTGCVTRPGKKRVPPKGRAVVVVDRGWIFAGDLSLTSDGYLRIDNAIHVFKWSNIGFAKMVEDWKSSNVDLRPVAPVEVPLDAIVFRVPVEAGWGKK